MKQFILFSVFVFSTLGSLVPWLFGDHSFLDGWGILGGFVGGVFGIWFGVVAAKRWG